MELLLAAGADPKQTGDGKATPLHAVAAVDGKDEQVAIRIAQALLAAGADANAQDEAGFTALVVAAARRQMALVRLLLPVSSASASGLESAEWTEEGVAAAAIARLEKLRGMSGAKGAADHAAETAVTVPEPAEPDEALAADCKRKGDEAFVKREYAAAEQHYSASLRHATRNHVVSLPHCTTPACSVVESSALCTVTTESAYCADADADAGSCVRRCGRTAQWCTSSWTSLPRRCTTPACRAALSPPTSRHGTARVRRLRRSRSGRTRRWLTLRPTTWIPATRCEQRNG